MDGNGYTKEQNNMLIRKKKSYISMVHHIMHTAYLFVLAAPDLVVS